MSNVMSTVKTLNRPSVLKPVPTVTKARRIESIDLLRGVVMIIMAIDHVRDYFHYDAFLYNPGDLTQTNAPLFFTRFITHYCAPVFVFLAGMSAFLSGTKKTKKELSFFLFTRGIWLVLIELFIVSLFRTFNPLYIFTNLQVIWAIGVSMMVLSGLIYLNKRIILAIGLLLIFGHNLLDTVHVPGKGVGAFLWALLHDPIRFNYGNFLVWARYPLLPWIGIMATGYCLGTVYTQAYNPQERRKILLYLGLGSIALFILLRSGNFYGDAAHWSVQKDTLFSILSFLNVSKYPPSLLYTLITLGPALVFLALSERPLNALASKIVVFGRVPMFYYLAHILAIHILAVIAAIFFSNTPWMNIAVLNDGVNSTPALKGFGYNLAVVYLVWAGLILLLYPFCKRFDDYKRANVLQKPWLSYF
jgi:uncharacterized membrane protein